MDVKALFERHSRALAIVFGLPAVALPIITLLGYSYSYGVIETAVTFAGIYFMFRFISGVENPSKTTSFALLMLALFFVGIAVLTPMLITYAYETSTTGFSGPYANDYAIRVLVLSGFLVLAAVSASKAR